MSVRNLPDAAAALVSLRAHGNQFSTSPLAPQPLGGLTYKHPTRGDRPVRYDARVLAATGVIYCSSRRAREALDAVGGRTRSMYHITDQLERLKTKPELVWSVSGYASIDQDCSREAAILEEVYKAFRSPANQPALVCDGAAGAGVLGINGVLAQREGIPNLGITPYQGISSMAPRQHMIVYGDTYRNREVIVGSIGDVLLVAGGGEGALRELRAAEAAGCVMVLLGQYSTRKDSLAQTWQKHKKLTNAQSEGRLIIPETKRVSIADIIRSATQAAAKFSTSLPLRTERLAHLRARLHGNSSH